MMGRVLVLGLSSVICVGSLAASLLAQESSVPYFIADENKANQRIWETLQQPLPKQGLQFVQTPLEEIIQTLRDEYEIEIVVDKNSLQSLAIDLTKPKDLDLRNTSLSAALTLLLNEDELTYIVANEVLLITTQEVAETTLSVVVYPIGDLIEPVTKPPSGASAWADYDVLIGAITECVSPESWHDNGGQGNLRRVGGVLLVVRQSQTVHEELRKSLAALRRAKQFAEQNQPAAEPAAVGGEGGFGGRAVGGGFGRGFGEEGGFGRGGFEGGGFGGGRPGRETPSREKEIDEDPFGE